MEAAKTLVLAALLCGALIAAPAAAKMTCSSKTVELGGTLKEDVKMENHCVKQMVNQIKIELTAALTYLSMAAHFSQDSVNLPGFAKFFFESASEERQHAIKVIDYLLMRNEIFQTNLTSVSVIPTIALNYSSLSGTKALSEALALEVKVTNDIRNIIIECESGASLDKTAKKKFRNDYHLVDYLSGEFLTEQYNGQRDLAGKIMTLDKMTESYGSLAEFLFDKKLLMGEV